MKYSLLVVYRIYTHSGRHNKSSLKEHGLLEGTPEAGLLVAETLTGVAVLSRAVHSVAPIQVLLVARVAVLGFPKSEAELLGSVEGPICGNQRGEEEEKGNGGHGEDEEDD